jgi:hypothetical protein
MAYLQVNKLTKEQKKEQLLDRALAGNAKLITSQHFQGNFGQASPEEILDFLESKINAHLGIRGKAEMIKRVQQNTKEESLINLFLALELAFASRPNATEEDKILAAFDAFRSKTLADNVGKREREIAGNWTNFQRIASEEWGFMGGKDNSADTVAYLQNQILAIQEQSNHAMLNQQKEFEEQILAIHQESKAKNLGRMKCFRCGKAGHKKADCRVKIIPQKQIKRTCEYHGPNNTHTSAECIVLKSQREQMPRADRPTERRVHFNAQSIQAVVDNNKNPLSSYPHVINSSADFTADQKQQQTQVNNNNNLIKEPNPILEIRNSESSKEKALLKSGEKKSIWIKESITEKFKNTKTNSSSLYLDQAINNIYQNYQIRTKKQAKIKVKKSKAKIAKWRAPPNQVNSILDIEILKVRGRLNEELDEDILVDTGARSNVIRMDVVKKLNALPQIVPTDICLTAANNTSLKVLGRIKLKLNWKKEGSSREEEMNYALYESQVNLIDTLPFDFSDFSSFSGENVHTGQNCFDIDFIVVDQLSVPAILGTKGIKQMNMKLDFGLEKIIVNGKSYPFINSQRVSKIYSTKKATIPPLSFNTIEVEGDLNQAIYSIEEYCQDTPIQVIESGFTAENGRNIFKICIKNLSQIEYVIPAKSVIAIATSPVPIKISSESNMIIQSSTQGRTIAAISENSKMPSNISDHQERISTVENEGIQRDELIVGQKMTNLERKRLFEVIKKEEATFKEKLTEEIRSDILPKYHMKLKEDAIPHIAAMGRLSPDKEELLEKEIQDLLARGLIEFSDGTWRARVVLVKKKDGKWRRCIDYRVLNEMTIADSYPMTRIDETLDQLGKAKYFSKLDMVEGYYQIPLQEDSKPYTGFATRSGFYQWKYLPMGFKNAGAAFQRQMDTVLGNMRFKFCIPYIDDIIIFSQTFEEHISHLKQVFDQFRKFGLFVKMSKCEFCMDRMDFLGHEVSAEGLRPNANKVKAINAMPTPSDPKQLVRFLAMAGFYRRYIKNFASRTHTLRSLCKQDSKWSWSHVHQKEIEDIKRALTSEPVMAYPDWDKKFILTTDASLRGLGAILSQKYESGERVIAYASRALADGERKWGITELEALAVIWGTEQFKVYLEDRPFDLITDHKALLAFKKITNTNPRLERWSIKLSRFTYDILYRKGEDNVNADCLSRDPINSIEEDLIEKQKLDKHIQVIRKLIRERGEIEFERNGEEMEMVNTFKIDDNQWFIEKRGKIYNRIYITNQSKSIDRLVIPQGLKRSILKECHETGHFGYSRSYEKLKERFYWSGMSKDMKDFVESCEECSSRNHTKAFKRGLMFSPEASRKFELLGVDLYTGIPKGSESNSDTILVMTDYVTKWVVAVPVKDGKAKTIAEAIFDHWVTKYGPPERIISDEGGEFNAKKICEGLYEIFKIKKLTTSPYHQQANGQCERFNRTMSGMLAKYVKDNQANWEKYLSTCVLQYNCSKHSTTRESPYLMVFQQEPKMPIDLVYKKEETESKENPTIKERIAAAMRRMKKNQKNNKKRYDEHRTIEEFRVGDFVLWRQEPRTNLELEEHAKLISPWYGPATIGRYLGQNKYLVVGEELVSKVFNTKDLKKYTKRPEWMKEDYQEMEVEAARPAVIPTESNDDIPIIAVPVSIQEDTLPDMQVEPNEPTGVRRSTREKKYIPKVGDKIDMRFYDKEIKKKFWSCGTATEIDKEDPNRIYFKFLDGNDEDWYHFLDEEIEIRKCIPSEKHQRSAQIQILNIETEDKTPKKLTKNQEKRKRKREEEGLRTRKK